MKFYPTGYWQQYRQAHPVYRAQDNARRRSARQGVKNAAKRDASHEGPDLGQNRSAMNSELWATIRRLHEIEKLSKSAIAERLKVHRGTVRRALRSVSGPPVDKPRRILAPEKLEAFKAYLQERLATYPELSGAKLFKD